MTLGEYHRLEDHCGTPCYVQVDTADSPCYIYRAGGVWHVDHIRDNTHGRLFNSSTGATVPTEGWEVRVNLETNQRQEDRSLTVSQGSIPVCSKITVRCNNRPEYSGTYTPTRLFSAGRIVFHNSNHSTWLCQQPTSSVWCITSNPLASTAGVVSSKSSLCPADPRAGGWQYWDHGWVTDSAISVNCRDHKYRLSSIYTYTTV